MENEIKDHAVKAYKTLKNPNLKFWHKVGEIGIEIGIIVFAVTLSIWVHDISDHNHEQKEVRAFLMGLKKDLSSDLAELQDDRVSYVRQGLAFNYIATSSPNFKLSMDSLKKHLNYLYNITTFVPNSARYEGFKSSGKLGNIEDDRLQNDISELYQGIVPAILVSTNSYIQRKQYLFEYFYKNLKRNKDGSYKMLEALSTDEAFNICSTLTYAPGIVDRYDYAIKKSKEIISEINAEYDLGDSEKSESPDFRKLKPVVKK